MDKVNFGGKDRPVKYNFNAIEELQDMGFDILNGAEKLLKSLKFIRAVAYIGLKYGEDETGQKEPELNVKQVGAILKNSHLEKFLAILNKGDKDDPEPSGESVGAVSSGSPSGG